MTLNEQLIQAQDAFQKGDRQACKELLEPLLEQAKQQVKEDENTLYASFEEPVQEFIYTVKNNITKPITNIENNLGRLYKMAGILAYHENKIEEAKQYYAQSLEWNPCDLETRLLEAECYKGTDVFKQKNLETLEITYRKDFIAQIYLNLSTCFEDAITKAYCIYYGHYFDYTIPGMEEAVVDIAEKTGIVDYPKEEELMKVFEKEKIPKAPDSQLSSILFSMGLNFEQRKNYPMSLYAFNLLYDLNHDPDVLKKIQVVKEEYGQNLYPAVNAFFEKQDQKSYVDMIEIFASISVLVPVKKENERELVIIKGGNGETAIPIFYEVAQTQHVFGEDVLLQRMDMKDLASVVYHEKNLDAIVYNPFNEKNVALRKDVLSYLAK